MRKIIEISTAGTQLSVAHRQLVIRRLDQEKITRPIEDIGVLIIDDQRASYTQSVLVDLLSAGATVIVSGPDHLPIGMMLPLSGHHVQTERQRAQIAASRPKHKKIWQSLVTAKIMQQAAVLDYFGIAACGLTEMARRVRSGDPDNLEAQAAQRYWLALFGREFRRDRSSEGLNALLNYGYSILRSSIARSITASGLIPSLGVFHKNRSNAFCLADDLLEPFRPYVDWKVKLISLRNDDDPISLDHRSVRSELLSLLNETILLGERKLPLLLAAEACASSLAKALTTKDAALILPVGMPVVNEEGQEGGD